VDEKVFFTTAVRARILDFILRRKRYTEDQYDDFAFGIERLLGNSVYSAAYPLHDVRNNFIFVILIAFKISL